MTNQSHYRKRAYLAMSILLAGILGLIVAVLGIASRQTPSVQTNAQNTPTQSDEPNQTRQENTVKSFPLKYLPEGARIENQSKDIVSADLDGDGQQEVIIFYSFPDAPNAGIVVLKPAGAEYTKVWERVYDDSSGFVDPSGVYDLNKSGRPQIVAYRRIGASCPGVLEIYESRNGRIERITGTWADDGLCGAAEFKDLNGDGRPEIIIVPDHGQNPDIYQWTGKQYVQSNRQFAHHYNDELAQLVRDAYSSTALPAYARVGYCKQAIEIYLLQRRYAEAIQLCDAVLQMIDDLT